MKANIQNLDIWHIDDNLFCKRADGYLIHIQSDRIDLVVSAIKHIQQSGELEPPLSEELTPELFSQIASFLLDNGILTTDVLHDSKKEKKKIGFVGPDSLLQQLPVHIHADGFTFNFEHIDGPDDLQGLHLLLVISPVFDHYKTIMQLSDAGYRQGIPLLYSELAPTTFAIGPLSVPKMDTPSLGCYIKRKAVNLKNTSLYATFIRSDNKEQIAHACISEYPYFEAGMNMIRCEVAKFFRYKGLLSHHLMGRSYTYDFSRMSVEESRVLKDPLSPLFAPNAPYTPFNG